MATIRNAIDTILQAASPRINSIALPSNITVLWGSQIANRPTSLSTLNATDGTTLSAAAANATSALAELADIANDGILTPKEKPEIKRLYDALIAEQSGIDSQATSFVITTEKTAYDNAVSALTSYLATLTSPVLWSNYAGNTTVTRATFITKFNDAYASKQSLLNAIYAAAKVIGDTGVTNAATANAAIADIASDNKFSPVEKSSVRKEWDILYGDKPTIEAMADLLSISTEKTAYQNYFQALADYLNNGSTWTTGIPSWISDANLSTTTTIVGATFRTYFKNFYDSKQLLFKKIQYVQDANRALAATTAAWTGVSGAGKPDDNATVGATFGTNVYGTASTSHISANAVSNITSASHYDLTLTSSYQVAGMLSVTGVLGGKLLHTLTFYAADSLNVMSGFGYSFKALLEVSQNAGSSWSTMAESGEVMQNAINFQQNYTPSAGDILFKLSLKYVSHVTGSLLIQSIEQSVIELKR